jgi:hypothetical protein
LFLGLERHGQSQSIQGVQTLGIDDVQEQQLRVKQFRKRQRNPEGLLKTGREFRRHQNFREETIGHGTCAYSLSLSSAKLMP